MASKSNNKPRRVTMCQDVRVRLYDPSPHEVLKDELWYSSRELRQQWKHASIVADRVRGHAEGPSQQPPSFLLQSMQVVPHGHSEPIFDQEMCVSDDYGSTTKAYNRWRSVMSVLLEQYRQDMEGTGNEMDIAMQYRAVTVRAQEEAHFRGMMNFRAASAALCGSSRAENAHVLFGTTCRWTVTSKAA